MQVQVQVVGWWAQGWLSLPHLGAWDLAALSDIYGALELQARVLTSGSSGQPTTDAS